MDLARVGMKLLLPESESESPKMNIPGGAPIEAMNLERKRNKKPKLIKKPIILLLYSYQNLSIHVSFLAIVISFIRDGLSLSLSH